MCSRGLPIFSLSLLNAGCASTSKIVGYTTPCVVQVTVTLVRDENDATRGCKEGLKEHQVLKYDDGRLVGDGKVMGCASYDGNIISTPDTWVIAHEFRHILDWHCQ